MNDSFFAVCILAEVLLLAGIIYTAIRPSKWKWRALYCAIVVVTAVFFCHYFGCFFKDPQSPGWSYDLYKMKEEEFKYLLIIIAVVLSAYSITKACRMNISACKTRSDLIQTAVGTVCGIISTLLTFQFHALLGMNYLGFEGVFLSMVFFTIITITLFEAVGGCSPTCTFLGSCITMIGVIVWIAWGASV